MLNLRRPSSNTAYILLLIIYFHKVKIFEVHINDFSKMLTKKFILLDICPSVTSALSFNLGLVTFFFFFNIRPAGEKSYSHVGYFLFVFLVYRAGISGLPDSPQLLPFYKAKIPVLLREDIVSFSTKKFTLTGEKSLSQLLTLHSLTSLCIHFTLLSQRK